MIGLPYKCVLKGINQNAVIAAENWQGPSQKGLSNNMHVQKLILMLYHIQFVFYFAVYVYMQSNAWQRSCVRNPAIKKAQGAKWGGGRRKPAEEEEGGGRGGSAAAEEASVFPQERGCRAK